LVFLTGQEEIEAMAHSIRLIVKVSYMWEQYIYIYICMYTHTPILLPISHKDMGLYCGRLLCFWGSKVGLNANSNNSTLNLTVGVEPAAPEMWCMNLIFL